MNIYLYLFTYLFILNILCEYWSSKKITRVTRVTLHSPSNHAYLHWPHRTVFSDRFTRTVFIWDRFSPAPIDKTLSGYISFAEVTSRRRLWSSFSSALLVPETRRTTLGRWASCLEHPTRLHHRLFVIVHFQAISQDLSIQSVILST